MVQTGHYPGQKKPKGWVKEPVRHGLAAKGVPTGRKKARRPGQAETPDERDFRRGEVRRDYAEPVEPQPTLEDMAEYYMDGTADWLEDRLEGVWADFAVAHPPSSRKQVEEAIWDASATQDAGDRLIQIVKEENPNLTDAEAVKVTEMALEGAVEVMARAFHNDLTV